MGTNYYLHKPPCPCCNKGEKIHLGKSSAGWKFLFHKTKEIYDFDSFCKVIKTGLIYNEYGEYLFEEDLLNIIFSKLGGKEHPDVEHIDGYDFLECDFC